MRKITGKKLAWLVWLIASLTLTLVLVPLCIKKEAYDDLIILVGRCG